MLGHSIKKLNVPRTDIVVSTKLFWGTKEGKVNTNQLNRKHIIEGLKASLKRLQLSYVDIVFAHRADDETPLEE